MFWPRASRLALILLIGAALPACDGTTEPDDGALAGLNELAIQIALFDRMIVFNHSREANLNLGSALGTEGGPLEPIPAGFFGHTLAHDFSAQEWGLDDTRPAVGADVLRVIWYRMFGGTTLMNDERGHVDLTHQTESDPDLQRVRVQVVRTSDDPAGLADYVLRFGTTEAGAVETHVLDATGIVSDGTSNIQFAFHRTLSEQDDLDIAGSRTLTVSAAPLSYTGSVDETLSPTTGVETVAMALAVTISGETTSLSLNLQETNGQDGTGSGEVVHAGTLLADIVVTGGQLRFERPGGGSFSQAQRSRLANLLGTLFNPVPFLDEYFQ